MKREKWWLLPSFLTYGTHWMREKLFWLHVFDGDIEPETLVTRAYNYRRWRIAQTIEKLGFNLCFFGLNSYGLLVKVYEFGFIC